MNQAPTSLIEFSCASCHTVLSVPREMSGVTGPCPHCNAEVTAPGSFQKSQTDVASPASSSASVPRSSMSRTLIFSALIASCAGLFWSLHPPAKREVPEPVLVSITKAGLPFVPNSTMDPRTAATERGKAVLRKFMAAKSWQDARKLVATQDNTGSISEPAWQPERYLDLLENSNFTPLQLVEQGSQGDYQIVWQVDRAGSPDKLLITTADTAEGHKVRWAQPPVLVPVVVASQASQGHLQGRAQQASMYVPRAPTATPAPENAALAAASLTRPEAASQGAAELTRTANDSPEEAGAKSSVRR